MAAAASISPVASAVQGVLAVPDRLHPLIGALLMGPPLVKNRAQALIASTGMSDTSTELALQLIGVGLIEDGHFSAGECCCPCHIAAATKTAVTPPAAVAAAAGPAPFMSAPPPAGQVWKASIPIAVSIGVAPGVQQQMSIEEQTNFGSRVFDRLIHGLGASMHTAWTMSGRTGGMAVTGIVASGSDETINGTVECLFRGVDSREAVAEAIAAMLPAVRREYMGDIDGVAGTVHITFLSEPPQIVEAQ